MRKPRDIDAELKVLQEKERTLKAQKKIQLGELVIATGADALDMNALAGLLLGAADSKHSDRHEGWRQRGTEFFQSQSRSRRKASEPGTASQGASGDTARIDANGGGEGQS